MRVNTRYINSTRGTSSTKECPSPYPPPPTPPLRPRLPVACIPYISGTLCDAGVRRHMTEPIFILDRTQSLNLEISSTCKHTNTFTSQQVSSKTFFILFFQDLTTRNRNSKSVWKAITELTNKNAAANSSCTKDISANELNVHCSPAAKKITTVNRIEWLTCAKRVLWR